ncbi:single-stranded-DNA-specific exonuclease RecJ [Urechidicola sp. KH5]
MRWTLAQQPLKEDVQNLASQLNGDRLIASLLLQRGINSFDEAKAFFRPSLSDLHNPFLMKDMATAVARIEEAIYNDEKILVYGDYDVDGTTAVSLVYSYLISHYPLVSTYIPDRYKEGYGVSLQGIDYAHDNDFSLIIALDCGVKAIEQVKYANERDIDFIICDHHRPGKELPNAIAVLDPKREDCQYPYDELCGCGVGFKLIQALGKNRKETIDDFLPYLDLVATAIAADIVPMTGENRVLAYYGLKVINSNPRIGIKAMTHQLNKSELTITDVVFVIAPRINAAGRMKHGQHAVTLLTETDFNKAASYALEIDVFNQDRKELDKTITYEALEQIRENNEEQNVSTVVYSETWHKGVIGIVASRLIETYYRPTLVFTKSGEKLAASARSVKGFDVYNAIEQCTEFVEQFGGHKYAAGLTLLPENYQGFKDKFEEVVKNTLPKELKTPELQINSEVELEQLTPKFYKILKQFAPFGPSNMRPVFAASGLRDNGYGKCVGADKTHLKLGIINGADQKTYNAIGFGLGEKQELTSNGKSFKAAFVLDENHWNGITSLQLQLKDIAQD